MVIRLGRALGSGRGARLSQAGDALLAVLLAGTSVGTVLAGVPAFGHPKALALVVAVVSTLPVAFRRRWPIPVAAVLLFANGAELAAAAPHEGALQPYIALVLAGYSVGSRAEGRYALIVPACLAVLTVPVFAEPVVPPCAMLVAVTARWAAKASAPSVCRLRAVASRGPLIEAMKVAMACTSASGTLRRRSTTGCIGPAAKPCWSA